MKGMFSWARRLFVKERGKALLDDIFAPVDPEIVIQHLDIEHKAREAGEKALPASDSEILDANEQRAAHYFEEDAQDTAKRANDKLHNYRRSINQLDIQHDQQSINSAVTRYKTDSKAFLQECRDVLKPYISVRSELTAELSDFKQQNKIRKSADYPESKFFFIAALVTLFVVESVLNAFFFAAGSDFGFIGGWINAMQYAFVNLAVAFSLTIFLVRQLNHIKHWRKFIGLIGVVSLIVFIPAFNFFVGHFREIYASTPAEAQKAAVQAFMANPFALTTVESWLLLAVGIIFASIAAFDGYRIEDPYPGYGRLWRRLENARDEYAEEKETLKNQLSDLRDSMIEQLDDARDRVMQREQELNDLASMAERIRGRYQAHLPLLERACNVVLSKYRQINQGVRETPAPVYFQRDYTFSPNLKLGLPDTITTEEVNKRKYGITSILELIEAQRNDIQSSYTEDLTSIDEAIQTLEYGA